MSAKFESMLSKHFEQSEIQELKNRVDYNETRLKVEQLQANHMLDDLESRVLNEIKDKSLNVHDRFEKFKASIDAPVSTQNKPADNIDPEEYIKNKKNKLREEFLSKLSGWDNPDITDTNSWTWAIWVWAFEQVESWAKLSKTAWFWEKFTSGLMSKIWVMVLGFLWFSKDYNSYLGRTNNIQIPDTDIIDNPNDNELENSEYKYSAIVNVFTNVFDTRNSFNKTKYFEVMTNPNFQELTLQQLIEFKQSSFTSNEYKEFYNPNKSLGVENIEWTIGLLTSWKGHELIKNIYEKNSFKWNFKELKIFEIFDYITDDLDMLNWFSLPQLSSIIQGKWIEKPNKKTQEILDKKWLSLNIINLWQTEWSFLFNNKDNLLENLYASSKIDESEEKIEEKEKIDSLVNFWFEFQKNLLWSNSRFDIYTSDSNWLKFFWAWDNDSKGNAWELKKIETIFSWEKTLSLKDVIKLRVITWWKTKIEDMNSIQQSALFMTMYDLLTDREAHQEAWAYITSLLDIAWWNSRDGFETLYDKVPGWVKDIMWQTVDAATNSAANAAWTIAEKMWWAFQSSPWKLWTAILAFAPIFNQKENGLEKIWLLGG